MITDDDITVASLAKLVGSELNTIDLYTSEHGSAVANKLDPKSFLKGASRRAQTSAQNNVVKHQGMMFHAGVDESYVQQLYPEPALNQPPDAQVSTFDQRPATAPTNSVIPVQYNSPPISSARESGDLVKVLQSIDKTLKAIDKNEKATIKLLTLLTTSSSDQNTSK